MKLGKLKYSCKKESILILNLIFYHSDQHARIFFYFQFLSIFQQVRHFFLYFDDTWQTEVSYFTRQNQSWFQTWPIITLTGAPLAFYFLLFSIHPKVSFFIIFWRNFANLSIFARQNKPWFQIWSVITLTGAFTYLWFITFKDIYISAKTILSLYEYFWHTSFLKYNTRISCWNVLGILYSL